MDSSPLPLGRNVTRAMCTIESPITVRQHTRLCHEKWGIFSTESSLMIPTDEHITVETGKQADCLAPVAHVHCDVAEGDEC